VGAPVRQQVHDGHGRHQAEVGGGRLAFKKQHVIMYILLNTYEVRKDCELCDCQQLYVHVGSMIFFEIRQVKAFN
jgi:hypothetical protein